MDRQVDRQMDRGMERLTDIQTDGWTCDLLAKFCLVGCVALTQVESRGLFVYLNSYYAKVCVVVVRDDVNYGSKNWVVISLVKHGIENI